MIQWGCPSCVNVQKVLWALTEPKATCTNKLVGGRRGGLDRPEFATLTPAARVALVRDAAAAGWESLAILRHRGRRHPGLPLGQGNLAQNDNRFDSGAISVKPAFIGLFWQEVRMTADQGHIRAVEGHRRSVASALAFVERGLGDGRPWLTVTTFGLADIGLGSLMRRLTDIAPDLRSAFRLLTAWHHGLAARPDYATHIAMNDDELRPGGDA